MKERMVTRTFKGTEATLLCMNLDTEEACNVTVKAPFAITDEKKLLKYAVKAIDNERIVPVNVVSQETFKTLYGITEEDFIKYGKVIVK